MWSAVSDPAFPKSLRKAGFSVEEVKAPARGCGKGGLHTIWIASKGAPILKEGAGCRGEHELPRASSSILRWNELNDMAMIDLQDVSVSFGGPPLLDHVGLQVERGERVALIGRNGEGKTTLLRLIHGLLPPDSGRVVLQKGVSVAALTQDLPDDLTGTVREVVAGRAAPALHPRPDVSKPQSDAGAEMPRGIGQRPS